jgi:hypothetical protein
MEDEIDRDCLQLVLQTDGLMAQSEALDAITAKVDAAADMQRSRETFLIDPTTPHGDSVISESSLYKSSLGWVTVHATEALRSGVHEWAVKIENQGESGDGSGLMLGIVPKTFNRYEAFISQCGGWCISRAGKLYGNWRRVDTNTNVVSLVFGTGDRVVFELDLDAGRMTVRVGDKCIVGEFSDLPENPEVYPAISCHYRNQSVRFDYRRVVDRNTRRASWIDRGLIAHGCLLPADTPFGEVLPIDPLLHAAVRDPSAALVPGESSALLRGRAILRACSVVQRLRQSSSSAASAALTDTADGDASAAGSSAVALDGGAKDASHARIFLRMAAATLAQTSVNAAALPTLAAITALLYDDEGARIGLDRDVAASLHTALLAASTDPAVGAAALEAAAALTLRRRTISALLDLAVSVLGTANATRPTAALTPALGQLFDATSRALSSASLGSFFDALASIEGDTGRRGPRLPFRTALSSVRAGDAVFLHTNSGTVAKIAMSVTVSAAHVAVEAFEPAAFIGHCIYSSMAVLPVPAAGPLAEAVEHTGVPVGEPVLLVCTDRTVAAGALAVVLSPDDLHELGSIPLPTGGDPWAAATRGALAVKIAGFCSGGSSSPCRITCLVSHTHDIDLQRHPRADCAISPVGHPPAHVALAEVDLGADAAAAPVSSPRQLTAQMKAGYADGDEPRVVLPTGDAIVDFGTPDGVLRTPRGHVTVEFWLRLSPSARAEARPIYQHGDKTTSGEVFVELAVSDGALCIRGGCRHDTRGAKAQPATVPVPPLCSATWMHVALVYQGTWSLVVDGTRSATARTAASLSVEQPRGAWRVAVSSQHTVMNLRVWRGARSVESIARDARRWLTGREPDLLLACRMAEAGGNTVIDSSPTARHGWITRIRTTPSSASSKAPLAPSGSASRLRCHFPAGLESVSDTSVVGDSPVGVFLPSVARAQLVAFEGFVAVVQRVVPDDTSLGASDAQQPTLSHVAVFDQATGALVSMPVAVGGISMLVASASGHVVGVANDGYVTDLRVPSAVETSRGPAASNVEDDLGSIADTSPLAAKTVQLLELVCKAGSCAAAHAVDRFAADGSRDSFASLSRLLDVGMGKTAQQRWPSLLPVTLALLTQQCAAATAYHVSPHTVGIAATVVGSLGAALYDALCGLAGGTASSAVSQAAVGDCLEAAVPLFFPSARDRAAMAVRILREAAATAKAASPSTDEQRPPGATGPVLGSLVGHFASLEPVAAIGNSRDDESAEDDPVYELAAAALDAVGTPGALSPDLANLATRALACLQLVLFTSAMPHRSLEDGADARLGQSDGSDRDAAEELRDLLRTAPTPAADHRAATARRCLLQYFARVAEVLDTITSRDAPQEVAAAAAARMVQGVGLTLVFMVPLATAPQDAAKVLPGLDRLAVVARRIMASTTVSGSVMDAFATGVRQAHAMVSMGMMAAVHPAEHNASLMTALTPHEGLLVRGGALAKPGSVRDRTRLCLEAMGAATKVVSLGASEALRTAASTHRAAVAMAVTAVYFSAVVTPASADAVLELARTGANPAISVFAQLLAESRSDARADAIVATCKELVATFAVGATSPRVYPLPANAKGRWRWALDAREAAVRELPSMRRSSAAVVAYFEAAAPAPVHELVQRSADGAATMAVRLRGFAECVGILQRLDSRTALQRESAGLISKGARLAASTAAESASNVAPPQRLSLAVAAQRRVLMGQILAICTAAAAPSSDPSSRAADVVDPGVALIALNAIGTAGDASDFSVLLATDAHRLLFAHVGVSSDGRRRTREHMVHRQRRTLLREAAKQRDAGDSDSGKLKRTPEEEAAVACWEALKRMCRRAIVLAPESRAARDFLVGCFDLIAAEIKAVAHEMADARFPVVERLSEHVAVLCSFIAATLGATPLEFQPVVAASSGLHRAVAELMVLLVGQTSSASSASTLLADVVISSLRFVLPRTAPDQVEAACAEHRTLCTLTPHEMHPAINFLFAVATAACGTGAEPLTSGPCAAAVRLLHRLARLPHWSRTVQARLDHTLGPADPLSCSLDVLAAFAAIAGMVAEVPRVGCVASHWRADAPGGNKAERVVVLALSHASGTATVIPADAASLAGTDDTEVPFDALSGATREHQNVGASLKPLWPTLRRWAIAIADHWQRMPKNVLGATAAALGMRCVAAACDDPGFVELLATGDRGSNAVGAMLSALAAHSELKRPLPLWALEEHSCVLLSYFLRTTSRVGMGPSFSYNAAALAENPGAPSLGSAERDLMDRSGPGGIASGGSAMQFASIFGGAFDRDGLPWEDFRPRGNDAADAGARSGLGGSTSHARSLAAPAGAAVQSDAGGRCGVLFSDEDSRLVVDCGGPRAPVQPDDDGAASPEPSGGAPMSLAEGFTFELVLTLRDAPPSTVEEGAALPADWSWSPADISFDLMRLTDAEGVEVAKFGIQHGQVTVDCAGARARATARLDSLRHGNRWLHLACTHDGTTCSIISNGALLVSSVDRVDYDFSGASVAAVELGNLVCGNAEGENAAVHVSAMRIWPRPLDRPSLRAVAEGITHDHRLPAIPYAAEVGPPLQVHLTEGSGDSTEVSIPGWRARLKGSARWAPLPIPDVTAEPDPPRSDALLGKGSGAAGERLVPRREWLAQLAVMDQTSVGVLIDACLMSAASHYLRRALISSVRLSFAPHLKLLPGSPRSRWAALIGASNTTVPAACAHLLRYAFDPPRQLTTDDRRLCDAQRAGPSAAHTADGAESWPAVLRAGEAWVACVASAADATAFVDECLRLLRQGTERFVGELPYHTFSPGDTALHPLMVDGDTAVPGSATLCLDGGRSVDYALVFADRNQKTQLAKLPDAQGMWPELSVSASTWFYVKPTSTTKNTAARFTVRSPSNMLRFATELLHLAAGSGNAFITSALCSSTTLAALTASMHSEVQTNRQRVMAVMTHVLTLWAANPGLNKFDQAPPSLFLHRFAPLLTQSCIRRGELPLGGHANDSSATPRFLLELLTAAHFAGVAFRGVNPWDPFAERSAKLMRMLRSSTEGLPGRTTPASIGIERLPHSNVSVKHRDGVWTATCDRGVQMARCTTGFSRGRWYFEAKILHSNAALTIGLVSNRFRSSDGGGANPAPLLGQCKESWCFDGARMSRWHAGVRGEFTNRNKWKARDTVAIAFDLFEGSLACLHNNRPVCPPFEDLHGAMRHGGRGGDDRDPSRRFFVPVVSFNPAGVEVNLGGAPFTSEAPIGFMPLDPTRAVLRSPLPVIRSVATVSALRAIRQRGDLPPFVAEASSAIPGADAAGRAGLDAVPVNIIDGKPLVGDGGMSVRGGTSLSTVRGEVLVTGGRWYYEAVVRGEGAVQIGWCSPLFTADGGRNRGVGDDANSWAVDGSRMLARHNRLQRSLGRHPWKDGDVIGCLVDCDSGVIAFSVNGATIRDPHDPNPQNALFRVPVATSQSQGLMPGATVDAESGVDLRFDAASQQYRPPDARPLALPDVLGDSIDHHFGIDSAKRVIHGEPDDPLLDVRPDDFGLVCAAMHETQTEEARPLTWQDVLGAVAREVSQDASPDPDTAISRLAIGVGRVSLLASRVALSAAGAEAAQWGPLSRELLAARDVMLAYGRIVNLRAWLSASNGPGENVKVTVNRRLASISPLPHDSLLGQVWTLLDEKPASFYTTGRRLFGVSFVGEGADDVGGPYRECVTGICSELMAGPATDDTTLRTREAGMPFAPTANNIGGVGRCQDCCWARQRCLRDDGTRMLRQVRFVGLLMGAALRAQEPLALSFPTSVWRVLVGDVLDPEAALRDFDQSVATTLEYLQEFNGADDDLIDVIDGTFTTPDVTGVPEALVEGGSDLRVTVATLRPFIALVRQFHSVGAARAVFDVLCNAFHSVVPLERVWPLSGRQLELLVCGRPDLDVALLARQARFEQLDPESALARSFFAVLRDFTVRERALFARFMSGRERLASDVRLKLIGLPSSGDQRTDDALLPKASTCFFWVALPPYSSQEVLAERLRYAVLHCTEIDADFRARDADVLVTPPRLSRVRQNDDGEFEDYSHLL